MNGDLALHRSSCPSAGRFDHQTGSGWQAHPRFKMFLAALMSRSMIRPQPGQLCTLTPRSFFTTRPHPEHICDVPLGSTSAIPRRALAATSAILVRILPMEASLYWFVILLERDLDLSCSTLRSCAQHGLNLGGESPLQALQWELLAETKGVHREVESERRSRQNLGPTNRKRI